MIKLLVSLAGTDVNGKPFSKSIGESVSLDANSEANYIRSGCAEPVKTKPAVKSKK